MRRRTILLSALTMLFCFLVAAERPLEMRNSRGFEREVLRGEVTGRPYFVPQMLLDEIPLCDLMGEAEIFTFETRVKAERNPHRYRQEATGKMLVSTCAEVKEPEAEGSDISPERIAELVDQGTSFLATVEAVIPGWSRKTVAELAVLRVVEVISTREADRVEPGSLVHIVTEGGRLRYEELVLCDERESWHRPRQGEQVLVVGAVADFIGAGYFIDWAVFEISGSEIVLEASAESGSALRTMPLAGVQSRVEVEAEERVVP
jgi:hypothetical protein